VIKIEIALILFRTRTVIIFLAIPPISSR